MDRLGALLESRISELENVTDHILSLNIDELRFSDDDQRNGASCSSSKFISCHKLHSKYTLPPPLLSVNERLVMAEYRRLAVKCENSLKKPTQRAEVVDDNNRSSENVLAEGGNDEVDSVADSCTLPISSWTEDIGMHPGVGDSQDTLVMASSIQSLCESPQHTAAAASIRGPTPLECEASPRFANSAPSRRGQMLGEVPNSHSQDVVMQTAVQFGQLKQQLAFQQKLQLQQLLDLQKQDQYKLQEQIERSLLAEYQKLAKQPVPSTTKPTPPLPVTTSPVYNGAAYRQVTPRTYTNQPPAKQQKRHSIPSDVLKHNRMNVITPDNVGSLSPTPLLACNRDTRPPPSRDHGDVMWIGKENSPAHLDRPAERTYRFKENFIYYDRLAAQEDHKWKFNVITAVGKSFLLRTLMKTDRVKHLIQTIGDSREFLLNMNLDSQGVEPPDKTLQKRVTAQLQSAMLELHDILLNYSTEEQMSQINRSRVLAREKQMKIQENSNKSLNKAPLSAATQKVLERKRQESNKTISVLPTRKTSEWRPGQTVSRGQKSISSQVNNNNNSNISTRSVSSTSRNRSSYSKSNLKSQPTHLTVKSRSPRPKSPKPDRKKMLKTAKM